MPELLKLTDDNYFSNEADRQYMSVSQFKSFLPQYNGCEAKAMAKLNGTYQQPDNTALLVGSYFHAHFEGTLDKFKAEHPDIFTGKGTLKSQYLKANEMINAIETDDYAMMALDGEPEKIFTAELFGVPWKIKVDRINLEKRFFIDLKTTRDFEKQWSEEERRKLSFVEAYGYIIQLAAYKQIVELATGANDMDGYILAVTKQDPPDKMVLYFKPEDYECGLNIVKTYLPHILDVKNGIVEPQRCGKCDYCRATKKLDGAIHYSEL